MGLRHPLENDPPECLGHSFILPVGWSQGELMRPPPRG